MKKTGYALVDKNGHYLKFEQVSDRDIDVSSTENPDDAELFVKATATEYGRDMVNETGHWKYHYHDCTKPEKIVYILKLIHVDYETKLFSD